MPFMVGQKKRKAGTRPTFRASSSNSFAGAIATGVNVTMPATVVAGDLAVFAVSCNDSTRTVTAPAGVTKIYDTRDWAKHLNASSNTTKDGLAIYTRWVQAGDASGTWNFKAAGGTGNEAIVAGVCVYSGVKRIAVHPMGTSKYGGSWQQKTPYLTSMSMGENNLLVSAISSMSNANFDVSGPSLVTYPAAYTVRENRTTRVGILSEPTGLSMHDAPTHGVLEETNIVFSKDSVVTWTHVMLELSGNDAEGWFENERVPTSLAGKPVYIYGTSNTCMIARIDFFNGTTYPEPKWTTQNTWPDWLQKIIDPNYLGNHMGIGGTNAGDNCTFAYGTHANQTRAMTANLLPDVACKTQVGTWTAQANRDMGGIVFMDIFGNDILGEMTPHSQTRDGATIAADALVRLVRSKYVRDGAYSSGTESTVFTGSWQPQSSDGNTIGAHARTLTPGDYVTITTAEPVIEVLLLAVDSAGSGIAQPGTTYTVHVDGVLADSGTTNDRLRLGPSSTLTPTYNYIQMAIPLSMGPGTHTVKITHTGAANTSLRYAGWLVPKTNDAEIPWVVLMGMQQIQAGLDGGNQTLEGLAAYLSIARTVAARFPSKVLVYDPNESGQWFKAGYDAGYGTPAGGGSAFGGDNLHMNNIGHAFFARDLLRFLNERIP